MKASRSAISSGEIGLVEVGGIVLCGATAIFAMSARRMASSRVAGLPQRDRRRGLGAEQAGGRVAVPALDEVGLVVLRDRSARQEDVGQQARRRTMSHRGEVRAEIAAGGVAAPMTRGARASEHRRAAGRIAREVEGRRVALHRLGALPRISSSTARASARIAGSLCSTRSCFCQKPRLHGWDRPRTAPRPAAARAPGRR